jgi:division protein CdvB (Snf7/Vps24/ESCRT-III family)
MSDKIKNETETDDDPTEEVVELMKSHDLDKEEAEHVQEIMEEYGLDEDDAVELADEL